MSETKKDPPGVVGDDAWIREPGRALRERLELQSAVPAAYKAGYDAGLASREITPETSRIRVFFSMLLAGTALDEGLDSIEKLDGALVAFSYVGNGASDAITVEDIRAFLRGPTDNKSETKI